MALPRQGHLFPFIWGRRGMHCTSQQGNPFRKGGRPMAAPTAASLLLPAETQHFHLIRPVCALGTFPSRGRLEKAFSILGMWFFDRLKKSAVADCGFFTDTYRRLIFENKSAILNTDERELWVTPALVFPCFTTSSFCMLTGNIAIYGEFLI